MFAHQVLRSQAGKVVHVTIVRFEGSGAGLIWGVAAPIHLRTIPHLMRQANLRK